MKHEDVLVTAARDAALGTPRLTLGRRAGLASVALAGSQR
jgi:hypothetical protein